MGDRNVVAGLRPTAVPQLLRRRGLTVFLDPRLLVRNLRHHMSLRAARRDAQYVLIDHRRIPVAHDTDGLLRLVLNRLDHVRDGLGYTRQAELPRQS